MSPPETASKPNPADHMKLVGAVVRSRHMRRYVENLGKQDATQWGYVGLCQACERNDESKGFKFSTYATSYIEGRIKRAAHENRIVRTPTHLQENRKAYADKPKVETEIRHYDPMFHEPYHLGDEWTTAVSRGEPVLTPKRNAESVDVNDLRELLGLLPKRERLIVENTWGVDRPKRIPKLRTARDLGISPGRTHTLYKRGMDRLKRYAAQREEVANV